jgi:prolyl oligopeptidase
MHVAVLITDTGFHLPEAKTRASYKSRNLVSVGTDFGPDSLTDSGYPRVVKEWVRGTPISEAVTVFEGEKTDVSVSAYTDDQRFREGPIYEIHARAMTFYTSKYWVRQIQFEHLLAPEDPRRQSVDEAPEFVQVDIQEDAEIDFYANQMLITLRSDWTVGDKTFKTGSLLAVDYNSFLTEGKDKCTSFDVLFEPTERTALETYSTTKNYMLLSIMDNVKSKLQFLKLVDGHFQVVDGSDSDAKIRTNGVRAYDVYENDQFWFSTSGYLQPSTLSLADADLVSSKSTTPVEEGKEEPYVLEHLKSLPDQFDASEFVTEQRMATSKDGTQIPYFLVRHKDTVMDGDTPTLLYGYGGFEISLTPHYIASVGVSWLKRGGAYVEANIRGGGEFGPSWHQAALKENRNKAFEDFIAVGEDLVDSGLCTPKTLAVRGGSNGGLLVGNMLVMRPDLFGAIHCAVPLLDMKRYHTLLAGASWMAEYGDPDKGEFDTFIHKYSRKFRAAALSFASHAAFA